MFTQKDIASILYVYYLDKYCQDTFSFDNGALSAKVRARYNKLIGQYADAVNKIRYEIKCPNIDGTDYDSKYFTHESEPELMLQVTSMIDYHHKKVAPYTGNCKWCDVGVFLLDYNVVDYDDLKD